MEERKGGRKIKEERKKERKVFSLNIGLKKNELDSEFPLVSACLILVTLSTEIVMKKPGEEVQGVTRKIVNTWL